jgi:3',5'-cyclic AMP phosphodiesterase CpdA
MAVRFLHAADIHLGFMQYNEKERYNDFARAFEAMAQDAIARRVDFVVLAGDLFHKRAIDPLTMYQATAVLRDLHAAHIPAIAIEGTHERSYYNEGFTWLDYLAESGLLVLLTPKYAEGRMALLPGTTPSTPGAYNRHALRRAGHGGALRRRQHAPPGARSGRGPGRLPRPAAVLHRAHAPRRPAGRAGQYSSTLTRSQLDLMRPSVDYLALGHIHKPFIQDGWIYNPARWRPTPPVRWNGTTAATGGRDRARDPAAQRVSAGAQPTPRVRCACALPWTSGRRPPTSATRCRPTCNARPTPGRATATGASTDDRRWQTVCWSCNWWASCLSTTRERTWTTSTTWPWRASIRCYVTCATAPPPTIFEITAGEQLNRGELEAHVLQELLARDLRRRDQSEAWAQLALRLKRLALAGDAPEAIANELRAFRDGAWEPDVDPDGDGAGEEVAPC